MTEALQAAITEVHHHRRQDRPDIAQAVAEDTAEAAQAVAAAMAEAVEAVPAEVEEDNKPLRPRHHEKDIHYNSADNGRSCRLCTERV